MTATMASNLSEVAHSEASLRTFLHGLPGVDQVGAEARAAMLGTRSIKTSAKAWAIELAIRMVDLTTLEGADTPGKVRAICAKAMRPDPPTRAARRSLRSASTRRWSRSPRPS
jgi:deoxyribose-phosphate aldolase